MSEVVEQHDWTRLVGYAPKRTGWEQAVVLARWCHVYRLIGVGAALLVVLAASAVAAQPAQGPRPSSSAKVTRALIRELAADHRPLAEAIDPARGLVRASWPNSGAEGAAIPRPRHLCGAALERALPGLRREQARLARTAPGGLFDCKNHPRAECVLSELVDEYSNHHHLVFRADAARGLVLESWIDLDESATSAESRIKQRRWAAALVRRARRAGCPRS